MKQSRFLILLFIFLSPIGIDAQKNKIDREAFFKDDRVIEMKLTTNIKQLIAEKKTDNFVDASVSMKFSDSLIIHEKIQIKPRGIFRKANCNMASLLFEFRNEGAPILSSLKKLKLVGGCSNSTVDEQLVLKEYMIYKIYNLFTEMSLRVRLLKIEYNDSEKRYKPYTQYAFLIEDIDDMAKRNNGQEKENYNYHPENTQRAQTTLVSFFQYMIGNTDWSITYYHNIKLIVPKADTTKLPYVIAYDFDVTGFVNAAYAVPPPELNLNSVTERLYRGFPRTIEEIEETANLFLQKEKTIYSMIENFEFFSKFSKKEMSRFLDDFFITLKNKKNFKKIFIDNARSG